MSAQFSNAPQAPPNWQITPEQLLSRTKESLDYSKKVHDQIAEEPNPSYENTIKKLAFLENEESELNTLLFLQHVSGDPAIRKASTKADEQVQEFSIEESMREDVYNAYIKALKTIPKDTDPESLRFADKVHKEFTRNGLALDKETRDKVKELSKRLSNLSITFSKNLSEENGFIAFTKEELDGLPESVLEQFDQLDDGKYKMTFKYPDVDPVFKFAKNQETRKRALKGFEDRGDVNEDILAEAIKIRSQKAPLLGYKTHSDYVLELRMAKSPDQVLAFLNDLRSKLAKEGQSDVDVLLNIKNEDLAARGLPKEDKLYAWDVRYYDNLNLERNYKVDHQKISEYFPINQTLERMLKLYEEIFSLKFVKTPDSDRSVWHEDVQQYSVWETAKGGPEFLGWLYLDLHPRDGKYGHAANFHLRGGYSTISNERVYPVTALVCNFSKPTQKKPSLLKHSEVTTLFHELGHGIHNLVGKTTYSRFHGTGTEWDFVEAPSQMLEFWTWNEEQLKDLSGHYQDPSKALDDELIKSLVRSKHVDGFYFNLRQIFFGLFDMSLHNTTEADKINLTQQWNDLREDICLVSNGDEKFHGYSSFGHIMGGYDSGYYGYLWSQVFAADIYYTKFKKNPLSSSAGLEYRDKILARGGSRDSMLNLRDLLGREPSNAAFLEEIGASGTEARL